MTTEHRPPPAPARGFQAALLHPTLPRLTRSASGASPAAPIRIVHLGLGAFHRAHQAWYTAHASDSAKWGIAAFTGRSAAAAVPLADQDGLYTLIERGARHDTAEIVGSISAAYDGADLLRLTALIAAETTAVITLTITEPGYHLAPDGTADLSDPAVAADLAGLAGRLRGDGSAAAPTTAAARLLAGLDARRLAGAGPLAVVPCDNIPANGALVRDVLAALAGEVDTSLAGWIEDNVAFVSTSVDRITPRTTDADRDAAAALTGYVDLAPVVTEPFSDWVLSGEFPAGRPDWGSAGARFVTDIEPFEQRKLRLLNGSHSLLAYLGPLRGHAAVADAIADPVCRAAVDALWREAGRGFAPQLAVDRYCAALIERFGNPRIAHHLAQIGMEGTTKLGVRIAPVALAERAAGRGADGCATVLAAWICGALAGTLPPDARADDVARAAAAPDPVRALLAVVSPELSADTAFVTAVDARRRTLGVQ